MPFKGTPRVVYGRAVIRICARPGCGHEFGVGQSQLLSGRQPQRCCSPACAGELVMLKRRAEREALKRAEGSSSADGKVMADA